MSDFPIHYRYKDAVSGDGLLLVEERFYPIRETKCFYFVLNDWQYRMYKAGQGSYKKMAKRVSKNGRVRKCYPTQKLAMHSYLERKRKQIWHAEDALNRARFALSVLDKNSEYDKLDDTFYDRCKLIGKPEFINEYVFD